MNFITSFLLSVLENIKAFPAVQNLEEMMKGTYQKVTFDADKPPARENQNPELNH